MDYSRGLEYIVSGYNAAIPYSQPSYLSRNTGIGNYIFSQNRIVRLPHYNVKSDSLDDLTGYKNKEKCSSNYAEPHSFTPQAFLNSSRPKSRFAVDINEIVSIAEETFRLMMNKEIPKNISINILPTEDFKLIHSKFGAWNNGIAGFSVNGKSKKVFVKETQLDELLITLGHEIGHVLTETLPNKHDEEAKAFAFSIVWANTIRKHDIANLGSSIKEELDFQPARNGLHDVALEFVGLMIKKGNDALTLHQGLTKKYISIFNLFYF